MRVAYVRPAGNGAWPWPVPELRLEVAWERCAWVKTLLRTPSTIQEYRHFSSSAQQQSQALIYL